MLSPEPGRELAIGGACSREGACAWLYVLSCETYLLVRGAERQPEKQQVLEELRQALTIWMGRLFRGKEVRDCSQPWISISHRHWKDLESVGDREGLAWLE